MLASLVILFLSSFPPLSHALSYQNPVYSPPFDSPIIPSVLNDPGYKRYLLTLSMTGMHGYAIQIFHSFSPTDWIQDGWAISRLPGLWQLDSNSLNVVRLLRTEYLRTSLLLLVFSGIHQGKHCIGYGFTKQQDYISFSINEAPIYCSENNSDLSPSLYQEDTKSRVLLIWSEKDTNGATRIYDCILHLMRGALKIKNGSQKLLLSAGPGWEGNNIHAPQLFHLKGDYYYLFYSGGTGNSSAIGVARARSFSGPFQKFLHNPILLSDPTAKSTGWHSPSYPSVVEEGNGVFTIFYQAVNSQTNKSSLLLDQLIYTRDQWFQLYQVCGTAHGDWYPSTCRHDIP